MPFLFSVSDMAHNLAPFVPGSNRSRRPMMPPIWSTLPVKIEPEICLESWAVIETEPEFHQRHFLGIRTDIKSGRISSEITSFDHRTMLGVTSTGRRYHLVGPPGWTMDTQYVLLHWCRLNNVAKISDVTLEYVQRADPTSQNAEASSNDTTSRANESTRRCTGALADSVRIRGNHHVGPD